MSENHKHSHCEDEGCSCHSRHNHTDCGCGCGHNHEHENVNKKDFAFKIISAGILFAAGWIMSEFTSVPEYVYLICFGISYIIVGFDVVKEAVEGLLHGSLFDENFLMTVASLGAFAIKEYSEGCAVMLLFTIGEFLQGLAVAKSKRSITDMLEKKPDIVNVIKDGDITAVSPDEISVGDLIVVKPGDKIHLDGIITKGSAEVDMTALTGESIPVSKAEGDEVLSGSVNIDGALTIRVTKAYNESTVARILAMLQDESNKKSTAEHFITRFARIYTPVVCLLALLVILIPPLLLGGEWREWIYRGLSALVVSCPCAIVISVPLCFFGGLGACSKEGILVKGSNYLEMLDRCTTGVFDKTGTITSGKFEFVRCECKHCHCSDKKEHHELLRIIAACEKYSNHPIAKSISLAFGKFADGAEITDAKNYAGMGVSAIVDGVKYYVGNEKLMKQVGVDFEETSLIGTAIYCCTDEEFLGDIVFADIIKEDSKEALAEMTELGVKRKVMLTGDREEIAKDISEKAGIDLYYSKLLPDEKVTKMNELKKDGGLVFYTGDGINDAPVLAAADLGIAMGGVGSDVAIEAADMVIMGDSLSKIPKGIRIARKTLRLAKENIIFSLLVKAVILVLVVFLNREVPMWLAVFGDVGVALIAILNSLRALIVKNNKPAKTE